MAEDYERKYSHRLQKLQQQLLEVIPNDKASALEFLEEESWDETLAECVFLQHATPKGLAKFCQQDPVKNPPLIDNLLFNNKNNNNNKSFLKEMLLADGASDGHYGPAMKIYETIRNPTAPKNGKKHKDLVGIRHRLALAIALEHAVPIPQTNPKETENNNNNNDFVDPIQRYHNYLAAYEKGELDPCFDRLSTFELRFVINGDEPDYVAEWGRKMLRNFRPDHILTKQGSYAWKYSGIVRSDVRYGSQDVKHDLPTMQKYQNILMNGGVCGRRAFFGRFILRSFGIPTEARPSKGHGALCHYTPPSNNNNNNGNGGGGWVVNLGGHWGCGWTKTRYKKDLDFLATHQARAHTKRYWKVKRAQWVGDVKGERPVFGEHDNHFDTVELYYGLSLKIQKAIIDGASSIKDGNGLPPEPNRKRTMAEKVLSAPENPEVILYPNDDDDDTTRIVIPASLAKFKRDVNVMTSFLGGKQIYLPSFSSQGLTIMRGGTWKNDANSCCSGCRMKSGGYGKYGNWGFRVAMSIPEQYDDDTDNDDEPPPPVWKIDLGKDKKGESVTLDLVYIQPGTFMMGGESTEDGRFQCVEVPKHTVRISKGYYIGKFPVTQAQYQAVIKKNPSKSTKAPDCPVDNIGETDAIDFCEAVTLGTEAEDVRLPTEAEWEYACRAGQGDTKWFFGDDPANLGDYAWFEDNANGQSHPVGQKKPNPWGLYDVYGNVCERVADRYSKDYYAKSPTVDPTGASEGTKSHFEFRNITISQSGTYALTARVVTVNANQKLNFAWTNTLSKSNENQEEERVLEMPFVIGEWQWTKPTKIVLEAGEITLKFWRDKPPQYGLVVKKFKLKLLES